MDWRTILPAAVLAIAAPVAQAQNPQPAPPGDPHPTLAPPNAPTPPPEQIAPGANDHTAQTGSLSDKLSRQQGTLQPPNVDPGINAVPPARSAGSMPVISPPGSPGGNQKVMPK
jgi:hypothetical protein